MASISKPASDALKRRVLAARRTRTVRGVKRTLATVAVGLGLWYASLPWAQRQGEMAAEGMIPRSQRIASIQNGMAGLHKEYAPLNKTLADATQAELQKHYGLTDAEMLRMRELALKHNLPFVRVFDTLARALDNGSLEEHRDSATRLFSYGWDKHSPVHYRDVVVADVFAQNKGDELVQSALKKIRKEAKSLRVPDRLKWSEGPYSQLGRDLHDRFQKAQDRNYLAEVAAEEKFAQLAQKAHFVTQNEQALKGLQTKANLAKFWLPKSREGGISSREAEAKRIRGETRVRSRR